MTHIPNYSTFVQLQWNLPTSPPMRQKMVVAFVKYVDLTILLKKYADL